MISANWRGLSRNIHLEDIARNTGQLMARPDSQGQEGLMEDLPRRGASSLIRYCFPPDQFRVLVVLPCPASKRDDQIDRWIDRWISYRPLFSSFFFLFCFLSLSLSLPPSIPPPLPPPHTAVFPLSLRAPTGLAPDPFPAYNNYRSFLSDRGCMCCATERARVQRLMRAYGQETSSIPER